MDPSLEAGTRIGRYILESLLGAGGMAEVWLVTDEMLSRPVALKIVLPKLLAEPEFVARFLREARVAAGLEHPNIPQIFDVGTYEGRPYLVYPLLSGGTLAARLQQEVSFADVTNWLGQLASALDYAHHQSIVHRDVKPANALFDKKDRLYLADFGLAKSVKEGPGLTLTGVLVGTPAFMSPEQASGGNVGPAADQYSLGIIAYRMLSGRLPFDNPSSPIVIHKILNEKLPATRSFRPELPPAVDRVLAKALNKRSEARFLSCAEFVKVLAKALDPATTDSVLPEVEPLPLTAQDGPPVTGSVPVDLSSLETGVAPPRRHKKKNRKAFQEMPASVSGTASSSAAGTPESQPESANEPARPSTEARVQRFRIVADSTTPRVPIFSEPERPQEVTDEVETLRRPKPAVTKPAPAPLPQRTPEPAPAPVGQGGSTTKRPPVWVWVLVAVVVLAAAAFFGLRSGTEKAPAPSGSLETSKPPETEAPAPSPVAEPVSVAAAVVEPTPAAALPEIVQPRLTPEDVTLESATVAVSTDLYLFIFSFDKPVAKPKVKDIKVPSIKVLSRGGRDLVSQVPKPRPYTLELKSATGNVLSFGLKVASTDFKGENVLMTGDTVRLDWGSQSPFGRPSVFALTSARR